MSAAVPLQDVSVPRPNLAEAQRALELFAQVSGQVTEVRALDVSTPNRRQPHTVHGFFANRELAARGGCRVSPHARGVYFMPNPVTTELLSRSPERMQDAKSGMATSDPDIVARHWFIVDCDPTRPSGTAATDEEKAAAHDLMEAVYHHLVRVLGWPEPVQIDSGNGFYLLFRIVLPTQDGGLVKRCLTALGARNDTDTAHIDTGMDNPARLIRLPGTPNCKGPNTAERTWRLARLVSVPAALKAVSTAQLEALAAEAPKEPARPPIHAVPDGAPFDIERLIAEHLPSARGPKPYEGGQKWVIPICPWNAEHTNGSAFIIQHPNGAISAGCHHNSCRDKAWRDLRALYAPPPIPLRQYRETEEENRRLRAENAELRADRDRLAAALAEAYRKIDLQEVGGDSASIDELTHTVAVEQAKRRHIVRILERTDMTHAARVTTAITAEQAGAYRIERGFGQDVEQSDPVVVPMWRVEKLAGIGKKTAWKYLDPAAQRDLISREKDTSPLAHTNGDDYRTTIKIGPGNGTTVGKVTDERRQNENERKERKRRELAAKVAELEAAAVKVSADGCPSCGAAMLPTGYFCPECDVPFTTEDLAKMPIIHTTAPNTKAPRGAESAPLTDHIYRGAYSAHRPAAPAPASEPRPTCRCPKCDHGGWSRTGSKYWYCSRCSDGYVLDDGPPETVAS